MTTPTTRHTGLDPDPPAILPVQRTAATADAGAPVRDHLLTAIRARRPGLTDIRDDDPLTSLGLDSLDRLAIATFLERAIRHTVPDPALANAVTVADLIAATTPAPPASALRATARSSSNRHDRSTGDDGRRGEMTSSDERVGQNNEAHGWVDPGGHVGSGTRLWHQAQVSTGARVGANCTLGKGAFVGPGSDIGDRVKIGNYANVFGATVADEAMISPGALLLEDPAPRATTPAGGRKGHDDFTRRPVTVARGATIGAGAVVAPGVTVGAHAMVALGAIVAHDVPAHALVAGNPARQCGWVCRCGHTLHDLDGQLRCFACPRAYRRAGDRLTETIIGTGHQDSR